MDTDTIKLVNDSSQRGYNFPVRIGPDGEPFSASLASPVKGEPPPSVTVPAWYFEELCKERGIKARFNRRRDGISVIADGSPVRLPEPGEAEEQIRKLEQRLAAANSRVAELNAEKRDRARQGADRASAAEAEAKEAKAAAKAAEKRAAEAEAELARFRKAAEKSATETRQG